MKSNKEQLNMPKSISILQLASNFNKNEQQKARLLKQIEQLGLDVRQYENMSLKELIAKSQFIMNNTYSIKYLGLNKNQMGIISRRINPLTDQDITIQGDSIDNFTVHKYFYPKPLKTGKKVHADKNINVDNLESEIKKQFEEKRLRDRQTEGKKSKQNREEKNRTKMAGSWTSNFGDFKKKAATTGGFDDVAQTMPAKVDPTKSFSRFLSKGILVVRD